MPYRTAAQIETIMSNLAASIPSLCTRIQLSNPSIEGRTIHALRLRSGGGTGRRGVLIAAGLHARELMNPDAIVELFRDLLVAYVFGNGITYGGRSWSSTDIRVMVETLDIWIIPCANPDGREHVQRGDDLWRGNRRDNSGTSCEGVDINRNFDIAWGTLTSATSCNPCSPSQTYCGSAAFSEPESRNLRDFCGANRVDVFVDVHSFMELVLYPWGHAVTQTTNPSENFATLASGTCATLNPPTYQEYMRPSDRLRFRTVSQRIVDSVRAVRGRNYAPIPTHSIYPTGASGTSSDYIYSRHLRDSSLHKTYAFAFETGPDADNAEESFAPKNETNLSLIKRDAKAAMLTLIEQSICAIDFIGTTKSGRANAVDSIRDVRDDRLATTDAGRGWIDLLERVQGPVLDAIMQDESLTKQAVELFERAAALADEDSAKLSSSDAAQARGFLRAVAKRLPADVRRDVSLVEKQLANADGRTAAQIIAALMGEPPRPTAPKKTPAAKLRGPRATGGAARRS